MRRYCQDKILSHIASIIKNPINESCKGTILILDDKTTTIIQSTISLESIMDIGVECVTSCSVIKKPQQNFCAIYFINPSSIYLLANDFQKINTFQTINLLICQTITPQIIKSVTQHEKIIERLVTFAQMHINVNYICQNIGLICSQMRLMKSLFRQKTQIDEISMQLFCAIISGFGDNISIEIYYNPVSQFETNLCKKILIMFQKHFEELFKNNQDQQINLNCQCVKLILVDRKIDIVSPAVRNFYYYPMIMDIIEVSNMLKPVIKLKQKSIQLSSDDQITKKYQNKHIYQALGTIYNDLKSFLENSKVTQFKKKGQSDNKSLSKILKQVPSYNKIVNSYNDHIDIMNELIEKTKIKKSTDIGQLQHTIISNINNKGQNEKDKKIYSRAMQYLKNMKDPSDRVRLLFIMICSLDIPENDRVSLIKKINVESNFKNVDVFLNQHLKTPIKLKIPKEQKKSFAIDRHFCKVSSMLQELLQKKSDLKCEKVKGIDFFGKTQKSHKNKNEKWVIFMAGGIGVNEISGLQKVAMEHKKQINILTDDITNPITYLKNIGTLYE